MSQITPCLWFESEAQEAANLYVSIFPDSEVTNVARLPEDGIGAAGSVLAVNFVLSGVEFQALNGRPAFSFTDATSFSVQADTQEKIDAYWDALTSDGGKPGQCGWLVDRFGLSWQIVPLRLGQLLQDPERGPRVMQVMLGQTKIVLAELEAA
ncbi:MAG: hypothetical protein JWM51_1877 [Microbacteriaceae bacterium]|nr:hypothetical protein [Microbacteriaceae bacterium]